MAETITIGGAETLDKFLELDDDIVDNDEPAEPRWKKPRDAWDWEEEARSFNSRAWAIFPGQNDTKFKKLSLVYFFDLFLGNKILELIANKSNQYCIAKFGTSAAILADEIRVFVAILILSGYNIVPDYKLYWSNSEDMENKLIKQAMSRDRFHMIKDCF